MARKLACQTKPLRPQEPHLQQAQVGGMTCQLVGAQPFVSCSLNLKMQIRDHPNGDMLVNQ